jgi:hypothetical protein
MKEEKAFAIGPIIRLCFQSSLRLRFVFLRLRNISELVQVAHTCNPSYSGGRDQEDRSLKPAWANSSQDPSQKNPSQKRAGGVDQVVIFGEVQEEVQAQKNWSSLGVFHPFACVLAPPPQACCLSYRQQRLSKCF